MKILGALVFFLAGLGAGLALVFANPLVAVGRLDPLALTTVSKRYGAQDSRGFDLSLSQFLGTGRGPQVLEDAANRHARITMIVLPAGDGFPAALAVKISVLSPQNSLWRARLGTLDYWNLWWPGEGSVFAASYSNYWDVLKDLATGGLQGDAEQGMEPRYLLTALPPAGRFTGVVGATGRFEGQPGDLRESLLPQAGALPAWQVDLRLDRGRQ